MGIVIYYKNSTMVHNIHVDLIVHVQFEMFTLEMRESFGNKQKKLQKGNICK